MLHVSDGVDWRNDRTYTPMVIYDVEKFSGQGDSVFWKMWFSGKNTDTSNYAIGYATGDGVLPCPVGGEAYPINKIAVLTPWIAVAVCLAGGTSWDALRRRRASQLGLKMNTMRGQVPVGLALLL